MTGPRKRALNPPRTAAESVAEHLRSRIASGELAPGEPLPTEGQLLEAYAVARPTMRGALRILESDGLIRVARGPRGGARVIEPELAPLARRVGLHLQLRGTDLRELFDAQLVTQPGAAALAAELRTEADLQALRSAVERCRDAGSLSTFILAVADFGTAVLEASHNRVLALYGQLTSALVRESLDSYVASAGITFESSAPTIERVLPVFATVVELIATGDAVGAERFWREHLEVARAGPWPSPSPFELYGRPRQVGAPTSA